VQTGRFAETGISFSTLNLKDFHHVQDSTHHWRKRRHGAGAAVRESIALGLRVPRDGPQNWDARSDLLAAQGAEGSSWGDLLDINTVRDAMQGVDAAYFVWPVPARTHHGDGELRPGRRKRPGVKAVVNLSQRSANREFDQQTRAATRTSP